MPKLLSKFLKVALAITILVLFVNTVFFVYLQKPVFEKIVAEHVNDDKILKDQIGQIIDVKIAFLGMKSFSWTGHRTTLKYKTTINGNLSSCTAKVVTEKKEISWSVIDFHVLDCE
jgi:hypothetical protein